MYTAKQFTVTDENGSIVEGATVDVFIAGTSNRATIYSDSIGTVLSNPFLSDANGVARFYAAAGLYRIIVTHDGDSSEMPDVPIGSAQGYDVGEGDSELITRAAVESAVADRVKYVTDLTALRAVTGMQDGQTVTVTDTGDGSSADYTADTASTAAEFLPYVVEADNGDRWIAKIPDGRLAAQVDLVSFIPREELKAISERTSTYDCHSALVAAVAVGRKVVISMPGRYRFDTAYSGTTDFNLEATTKGVELDLSNIVGAQAIHNSGSFVQIEELGADVVKGSCEVTFASAPSLSVGDWFCIYNPTDYSYSGWRANYRAGEFKQVLSISGSTVTTTQPFYAGYVVADVDVYRMDSVTSRLAGVHLIGGASPDALVVFSACVSPIIDRVSFEHANNSFVLIDRCVGAEIIRPRGRNLGDGGDDYGVSVSNSQHVRVLGGDIYSRRHAVALGGGNSICSVPVRDFRCRDAILRNDPQQSVGAADMHGNVADSSYEDCEIYGAANIGGGDENFYRRCRIHGDQAVGWCGYWREVLGGRSGFEGCSIVTHVNPQASSRGLFDIGGNAVAVDSRTTADCDFVVRDCSIASTAFSSTTSVMLMRNRGAAVDMNFDISRLTFGVNALGQVLNTGLVSGTASASRIIIDEISGAPAGTSLHLVGSPYTAFPHRLQRQSGRDEATTTAATTYVSAIISFPLAYPRTPDCFVTVKPRGSTTLPSSLLGGQNPSAYVFRADVDYIRPMVRTDAAMTAGDDFDLCWSAEIREC